MNVQSTIVTLALALSTTTACAVESPDPDPEPDLQHRLGGRVFLPITAPCEVAFGITNDATGTEMPPLQPEVTGGELILRTTADGLLLVEGLTIELGDVDTTKPVGDDIHRLQLTDLRLRLGTLAAIEPEWSAVQVAGTGTGDLLLDWALRDDDGDVHPLATQRVRAAELGVIVAVDAEGRIGAALDSVTSGRLWDFGDIAVGDLSLSLTASEPAGE